MELVPPIKTNINGLLVALGHGLAAMFIALLVSGPGGVTSWSWAVAAIASTVVFLAGRVQVPIGHQGVLVYLGNTKSSAGRALDAGNHWVYPIPYFVRVEVVNLKSERLTAELMNEEFHFDVWNMQRVTAKLAYVRWRIADAASSLEHDSLDAEDVKLMLQACIRELGQAAGAEQLSILVHTADSFRTLRDHVNRGFASADDRDRIPIECIKVAAPDIRHASEQFYQVKTAILLVEEICKSRGTKASAVYDSFKLAGGKIDYDSKVVDISGITDILVRYFKETGKW